MKFFANQNSDSQTWSPQFVTILLTIIFVPGGMLLLPLVLARSKALRRAAGWLKSQRSCQDRLTNRGARLR